MGLGWGTCPWSAYTRPEMNELEIMSLLLAPVLLITSEPSPRRSPCTMLGLGWGFGLGWGLKLGLG